jgi:hypothetical protein
MRRNSPIASLRTVCQEVSDAVNWLPTVDLSLEGLLTNSTIDWEPAHDLAHLRTFTAGQAGSILSSLKVTFCSATILLGNICVSPTRNKVREDGGAAWPAHTEGGSGRREGAPFR